MRSALGFLLSPLVGVLLPAFVLILSSPEAVVIDSGTFTFLLIPVVIAYLSAVLFGIPLFQLFKRRGWLELWQIMVGSILCGVPFAVLNFFDTAMNHATLAISVGWFTTVLVIATLTGVTFWAVAVWRK